MTTFGCTGCHRCDEVCPESLEPSRLIALIVLSTTRSDVSATQSERLDDLRTEGLPSCSDCGQCTEICPSGLPLEALLNEGKGLLNNETNEKRGSDHWKQRFNKRQRRVQTLKIEKTLNARATLAQDSLKTKNQPIQPAATSASARTEAQTSAASQPKERVAAADFSRDTAQSDIAAAVARVKAKRAAQKNNDKPGVRHDS